jgi:hypothetical protein
MSLHSEKVPKAMAETFAALAAITDAFCREHLNNEYAQLIRSAAAALCRKRPSPIARGTPLSWAAGITHAVGSANFLSDPTVTPHLSAADLCKGFGVSQSNALAKSKTARDLLEIDVLNLEWCLPSRVHESPMAWMIVTQDGLMIDARRLPREDQVLLSEAGLIPFVHADRAPPVAARDLASEPSGLTPAAPPNRPAVDGQDGPGPEGPPSPQLDLF